jgi:NADH pyrophosphatase NudC (nudix superfamily)
MQRHGFCAQCGSPTKPHAFGTRRQCTTSDAHRHYPRTDPVVIMLVESPDGRKALLGRSKKIPMNMQTCLSGFMDQAESIEEVCSPCACSKACIGKASVTSWRICRSQAVSAGSSGVAAA